jgi:anthranilate phosphoribosyltransferase
MKALLGLVANGTTLSEEQAEAAFDIIMSGDATPSQIGGFLMALRVRGETVAEITGAARAMRAKCQYVSAPEGAMDIVGTGGDATGTFNISTGAALVAAACGIPIAKHGNRALSSKSGSADTLIALGINNEAEFELIERAIRKAGIGFLMAPRHHSAMRHVGPTRVELATRTVFNLLGPICNPAGVKRQVTGVFGKQWVVPIAETLGRLGSEAAWVVHGSDGSDEITTAGTTFVAELKGGQIKTFEITPEDAGLKRVTPADLKGGDAERNAAEVRAMLEGQKGPYRDVVLMNAAAALIVAEKANDLKDGVAIAAAAIDAGKAKRVLDSMIAITNRGLLN